MSAASEFPALTKWLHDFGRSGVSEAVLAEADALNSACHALSDLNRLVRSRSGHEIAMVFTQIKSDAPFDDCGGVAGDWPPETD